MLIQPRELDQFPDEKLVIISTGSQGEPLSALRRMAYRDHPAVELKTGDTVVFSATPIPGNERAVNEVIDRLYHIGCDVVTAHDAPIHASGHGYAEELKLMLNLTHPRYVMPIHGDYKRMRLHSQLAEAVGVPAENIFALENGLPLEIDERRRPARRARDGRHGVRRRRRHRRRRRRRAARPPHALGRRHLHHRRDGLRAGRLVGRPARGARPRRAFIDDDGPIVDELREAVEDSLDRAAEQQITEIDVLEQFLHDDIAAFIYERLKRRPMVLPVVVEV